MTTMVYVYLVALADGLMEDAKNVLEPKPLKDLSERIFNFAKRVNFSDFASGEDESNDIANEWQDISSKLEKICFDSSTIERIRYINNYFKMESSEEEYIKELEIYLDMSKQKEGPSALYFLNKIARKIPDKAWEILNEDGNLENAINMGYLTYGAQSCLNDIRALSPESKA